MPGCCVLQPWCGFVGSPCAHVPHLVRRPQYGLPPPETRGAVPQVITFQRKRANRRVINEEQLVKMLSEFGEVGGWGRATASCGGRPASACAVCA